MDQPKPRKSAWTVARNFVLGCAAGGLGGFAFGRTFLKHDGPKMPGEDVAALAIGVVLLLTAAFVVWIASSPQRFKRHFERRSDAEPVDPVALGDARRSGWVVALAGVMLVIPPVTLFAAPDGRLNLAAAIGVFALLAVQSWGNWRIWRQGDELTRSVIVCTGAVCFWLLQGALFAWATAAHLGLVADVSSWTLMCVMMATYLVASAVVSVRTGYANV